ncbi:MAG: hypothetical protein ABIH59_03290 [archaeon]
MLNIDKKFYYSSQKFYSPHTDTGGSSEKSKANDSGKIKLPSTEARREYQRRYYQNHKEKIKEYQREYNKNRDKIKSKGKSGRCGSSAGFSSSREIVRSTYTLTDIMHLPAEKLANPHKTGVLDKICSGERYLTM